MTCLWSLLELFATLNVDEYFYHLLTKAWKGRTQFLMHFLTLMWRETWHFSLNKWTSICSFFMYNNVSLLNREGNKGLFLSFPFFYQKNEWLYFLKWIDETDTEAGDGLSDWTVQGFLSVSVHGQDKKQDLYYLTFNLFFHLFLCALSKTTESTRTIVSDCVLFPYDLPLTLKQEYIIYEI